LLSSDQAVHARKRRVSRPGHAHQQRSGHRRQAAINRDIDQLQLDLKNAQEKLDDMKRAGAANWPDFEWSVSHAVARQRQALEAA